MSKNEELVRAILAQLLEISPSELAVDAELFDLGLDSLTGLRFIRRLNDVTGQDIDLECLFDYPTISSFSQFLDERAIEPAVN